MSVNRRGPRSRAGLTGYPQLRPNAVPINVNDAPINKGWVHDGYELRLSVKWAISRQNIAVATIWFQRTKNLGFFQKLKNQVKYQVKIEKYIATFQVQQNLLINFQLPSDKVIKLRSTSSNNCHRKAELIHLSLAQLRQWYLRHLIWINERYRRTCNRRLKGKGFCKKRATNEKRASNQPINPLVFHSN